MHDALAAAARIGELTGVARHDVALVLGSGWRAAADALGTTRHELPAEIRMARAIGGDLVGMSTVLEAIAARVEGAEVLAISLVTNLAAGVGPGPLDHEEVLAAGRAAAARAGRLLADLLPRTD